MARGKNTQQIHHRIITTSRHQIGSVFTRTVAGRAIVDMLPAVGDMVELISQPKGPAHARAVVIESSDSESSYSAYVFEVM